MDLVELEGFVGGYGRGEAWGLYARWEHRER